MPAHNAAPFLPAAISSVQAQTFTDWEVVAVDDGSTDETWSILESAGPRVRALRSPQPEGPAAARNRALAEVTGELVAFLDADDLFLPRYLESQLACWESAVRAGRRIGVVTCDALLLEGDDYAEHTYLDWVRDRDRPLTLERVLRRNPIYISSLVPTETGQSVGWFDPELFGTEDFGLWLKILERGFEAILNPEPLAVYRRHAGTVSSNIARQGENNRRTYELALARGHLNARQRRIARGAIRYNRAMEAVAQARFAPKRHRALAQLITMAPMLIWVVLTNPRWWSQWVAVLRTGQQPPAAIPK
jgi:glycosyltransferase involved in cell wall biosynthesis